MSNTDKTPPLSFFTATPANQKILLTAWSRTGKEVHAHTNSDSVHDIMAFNYLMVRNNISPRERSEMEITIPMTRSAMYRAAYI